MDVRDHPNPEPVPTLASLRRRGTRSRVRGDQDGQADLFASFPLSFTSTPVEIPSPTSSPSVEVATSQSLPIPDPPDNRAENSLSSPPQGIATSRPSLVETLSVERETAIPNPTPSPEIKPETWTVSGLVRHVRGLVERGYGQVTVEGEISNWRPAGSGHCYFTVKDAGAQLSAVLFRRQASLLRFRPSDGDAVRCHGQLSIYENRGQMQLIVEWMEQVGLGALLAEVQRLKEKLRREGLFDRKRPLPPFPRCIGVITSLQGAALRDIIKVCKRRHAAVHLLIYPAAVQGPNCPAEIAAGLRWFTTHPDQAEIVLVARGGGSWEDLHGFDDERIARAIAGCPMPVITGIGHATDTTIADAAADLCAPTPSAAAELLTAAHHRIEERLARLHARLVRAGSHELLRAHNRFARLSAPIVLRRVEDSLDRRTQNLDELALRIEAARRDLLHRKHTRLQNLLRRLHRQSPTARLADTRQQVSGLHARLQSLGKMHLDSSTRRLHTASTRLEAMNPLRVLERGYALVYGPDGHLLRDATHVPAGALIRARLAEGDLHARVLFPSEASSPQPESLPRV